MSLPPANHDIEADQKTTSQLGDVLPLTAEIRDNHLWLGGIDMVELAHKEQTALYVYDKADLRGRLNAYHDALANGVEGITGTCVYAGKAFNCGAMAALANESGCWCDISSGGEAAMLAASGFPMEHTVVHGNNKQVYEIEEGIAYGVGRFVADSHEELARIDAAAKAAGVIQKVMLRITPGVVADTHSFITTGAEDSKFGFTLRSGVAMDAVEKALSYENIELTGFHFHIGSQILNFASSYKEAINVMVEFALEAKTRFGFVTKEFDTGGGLGIAYTADEHPSSIAEFCNIISEAARDSFAEAGMEVPHIFMEPGRSIAGQPGITLYTVGSIKEIAGIRTFVNIDGGMTDNIRTELYGAEYESCVANKADEPRSQIVTIAGKHCESGDVVALDASLQPAVTGDVVAMFSTGAYCQSMGSNYNYQVRPGVVFVEDGQYEYVIARESARDLMSRDLYINSK